MKKQIKSVSLVQNAKVVAAIYLVLSLPILVLTLAFGSLMNQGGASLGMMLFVAVAYVVFGFIFTLIGGWVYNLVAGVVGGFEFTTAEVSNG
jgi:hypothetical protein